MKKYKLISRLSFLLMLCFMSCKMDNAKSINTGLPYFSEATFTPIWLDDNSEELDTLHKIPAFKLIDQNGDTITDKTFDDKYYVTNFFFTTCPGICPQMTSNMAVLQDSFAYDNDVLLLSHSVTPTRDSVPALRAYAEEYDVIAQKWFLVTGEQQEIYRLGRRAYFIEEDLGIAKDLDEFLHTENFVLIDKNKHIRGIYNGLNKASVNQLIKDVKTLKSM